MAQMPTKTEKEKRTVVELLGACVITGVTCPPLSEGLISLREMHPMSTPLSEHGVDHTRWVD